jgi:hypothetical protein
MNILRRGYFVQNKKILLRKLFAQPTFCFTLAFVCMRHRQVRAYRFCVITLSFKNRASYIYMYIGRVCRYPPDVSFYIFFFQQI